MPPQELNLQPRPFPVKLLRDPSSLKRLNSALWLYLVLTSAAAPSTGQLQTTTSDLAAITGQKPESVSSLLGHLAKHGYVVIQRQSGWLQIRVADWPRQPPPVELEPAQPEPLSGNQALALRIAEAFRDEDNLGRYEELVETYPSLLVERAYRDAAAMPESQIRKSRGALFTYLLRNYAQDQDLY